MNIAETTTNALTISALQARCYQQSADKGFHADDDIIDFLIDEGHQDWAQTVQNWRNGNRIALQHSELSEALEEIRNGRAPTETYYPSVEPPASLVAETGSVELARKSYLEYLGDKPQKPEGVPSELADVVIRVLDFCGANGIDLESMIAEKLDYNATRGHKHGKKF